jgi:hypothetical protein
LGVTEHETVKSLEAEESLPKQRKNIE